MSDLCVTLSYVVAKFYFKNILTGQQGFSLIADAVEFQLIQDYRLINFALPPEYRSPCTAILDEAMFIP